MAVHFKNEEDKELIWQVHPILLSIFLDLANYAMVKHGIELTVTATVSTPEKDAILGRKSKAHQRKIAIDIRTKNLPHAVKHDLAKYVNNKKEYEKYRYESFSGIKRLAYIHVGSAEHLHLALHSRYADFTKN